MPCRALPDTHSHHVRPPASLSSRRRSCTRPVPLAFARVFSAFDAASTAIAGFALLAGARAFTFIALLAWREPVLGGAGLVLLGLVGWLRWFSSQRRVAGLEGTK